MVTSTNIKEVTDVYRQPDRARVAKELNSIHDRLGSNSLLMDIETGCWGLSEKERNEPESVYFNMTEYVLDAIIERVKSLKKAMRKKERLLGGEENNG